MLKTLFKLTAVALVVFVVGLAALRSYGNATYFKPHDPAAPLYPEVAENAIITEPVTLFDIEFPREYRRTEFSIQGRPGDRIPCVITQPVAFEGRLPTIVFVHGSGQTKRFIDSIASPFNKAGFNMVSFDQLGRGDRPVEGGAWQGLRTWYDRGWTAVDDASRVVDYLLTRDDVDPDRIYYVGASYGAMVGTHVLARDKRFAAGVLIVGGGDFRVMADAPLIRDNIPGPIHAVLKQAAPWIGGVFDPILSAPYTAPTPILKQCGKVDALVSPESGEALFAALGEPKELRWYDIDHPGLRAGDGPEIARMLDDALVWLAGHAGIPLDLSPEEQTVAAFHGDAGI